jgi:hypothetical protein
VLRGFGTHNFDSDSDDDSDGREGSDNRCYRASAPLDTRRSLALVKSCCAATLAAVRNGRSADETEHLFCSTSTNDADADIAPQSDSGSDTSDDGCERHLPTLGRAKCFDSGRPDGAVATVAAIASPKPPDYGRVNFDSDDDVEAAEETPMVNVLPAAPTEILTYILGFILRSELGR